MTFIEWDNALADLAIELDEVKYLKDKLSCPICNNSELEMNDEK